MSINVVESSSKTKIYYVESLDLVHILPASHFVFSHKAALLSHAVNLETLFYISLNDLLNVDLEKVVFLFFLEQQISIKRGL